MKIEETFRVKHEDTEEQTGWFLFSELTHLILIKMSISTEMKMLRSHDQTNTNTAFKMRRSCFHIRHLL